jgi:hypothetical protein
MMDSCKLVNLHLAVAPLKLAQPCEPSRIAARHVAAPTCPLTKEMQPTDG